MFSVIYKIRNTINDCCYVGSAIDLKKRWWQHKNELKKGTHHSQILQRAWKKYGEENFVFEIIEEILEKSKLIEREQYYTDILKPEYSIKKICNSNLGLKFSEEHKRKISESHMGEKNPNFGKTGELNPFFGRRHTEETKRKNSESHMGKNNPMYGKKRSEESKQKSSESLKKYWKEKNGIYK